MAERMDGNYAFGLALIAAVVAFVLAGLALSGPDTPGHAVRRHGAPAARAGRLERGGARHRGAE